MGYEVVQVQDGAAALMRIGTDRPDLIVMAGIVPDMELVDLCTALRRDPIAEKVPFVLVAEETLLGQRRSARCEPTTRGAIVAPCRASGPLSSRSRC